MKIDGMGRYFIQGVEILETRPKLATKFHHKQLGKGILFEDGPVSASSRCIK
jgi:hypothetical protein